MTGNGDKEERLLRVVKDAMNDSDIADQTAEQGTGFITVKGDGNMVAGGNIINISTTEKFIQKTKAPTAAEDAITPAQQAELQEKIKEWIEANNAVKKKDLTFGAAWGRFNKSQKVARYTDIKQADFESAKKWLVNQIGQLLSMKSAAKKDPEFRTKAYRAIHARAAQLGDRQLYKPYIQKRFGTDSLKELTDQELQQTRQWILRKR